MPRETITGPQLASVLNAIKGASEPVVLLFSSTRKEDGARWCPDCEAADPVLDEALEQAPAGLRVITVELSRPEWKESPGADHYLRKEPYGVAGIPTMLQWDPKEQRVSRRFGESDLLQLESVASFFASFATDAN